MYVLVFTSVPIQDSSTVYIWLFTVRAGYTTAVESDHGAVMQLPLSETTFSTSKNRKLQTDIRTSYLTMRIGDFGALSSVASIA